MRHAQEKKILTKLNIFKIVRSFVFIRVREDGHHQQSHSPAIPHQVPPKCLTNIMQILTETKQLHV